MTIKSRPYHDHITTYIKGFRIVVYNVTNTFQQLHDLYKDILERYFKKVFKKENINGGCALPFFKSF